MAAPHPITVDDIKKRLVGLDQWFEAAKRSGAAYDDSVIEEQIPVAIRNFERATTFLVKPAYVIMDDDGTYDTPPAGVRLIEEQLIPYYHSGTRSYMTVNVPKRPIRSILRYRIMLSPGHNMLTINNDWVRFNKRTGAVWLQPVSGNSESAAQAASVQTIMLSMGHNGYIPQSIAIDYEAGLPVGWQDDEEMCDLKRCLSERAAILVLQDISQVFDAGKSSKSTTFNGMGQNVAYTRFQERIASLQQAIDTFESDFKPQEASAFIMSAVGGAW